MRYYKIVITNPTTGKVITPSGSPITDATYTSYVNGQTLAGAWDVELDLPTNFYGPAGSDGGACKCRVWGISLGEISQANNLNGMNISVYGGMQKGLPLADPSQNGLLVYGYINQAFGNWVNTDMTLDLIIAPGPAPDSANAVGGFGSPLKPKNFPLNWKKGTLLKDAITTTLQAGLPNIKPDIVISDNLKLAHDVVGIYQSLPQFSAYIYNASVNIIDPTGTAGYLGVRMAIKEKSIIIRDGTTPTTPTAIRFQDMIGQPTWYDKNTINFKCVMRADLNIGDYITFPKDIAYTSTQQGTPPFQSGISQKSAFAGTFQITYMQHFGRYRQADAASWVTSFNVASVPQSEVNPVVSA